MGFYIDDTPYGHAPVTGKADWLLAHVPGARELTGRERPAFKDDWQPNLVCVVENGPFDAAGFVFDPRELGAFLYPADPRRKRWLVVPNAYALTMYGYTPQYCPSCDGWIGATPAPSDMSRCACPYNPLREG